MSESSRISKRLEPCHRNVESSFIVFGGGEGYPMLVTVCHSTSVQELRHSTPSTIRVQPCVMGRSACREGGMNSGSPEGCSCPSNAFGNSPVFCATRGGSLSSVTLAEILPYVWGLGFVLLHLSLSKIPLLFIHPLSPLKLKKRVESCLWKQGEERVKYQKYEALSLLLAFSTYADNICDLYG